MADPILISFRAEHLLCLRNRDNDMQEPDTLRRMKETGGPAFTAVLDGQVLGCAGLVIPWPGMGLAWMAVGHDLAHHGLWLTRTVKRGLRDLIHAYALYRVETLTLTDQPQYQRWLEICGFSRENGRARHYTPDRQDMFRYEWVEGD